MHQVEHRRGGKCSCCRGDDVAEVEAPAKEIVRQRARQPCVAEAELQCLGEPPADLRMLSRLEGHVYCPPCRTGAIGGRSRALQRRGSEQAERERVDEARQPRAHNAEDRAGVERSDRREQHGVGWIAIGRIHKHAHGQCEAANCRKSGRRRPLEVPGPRDRMRAAAQIHSVGSPRSHRLLPENARCTHAAVRAPLYGAAHGGN